ncbi:MAG: hypothetical protein V7788_06020 [Alphaproteobacteria bacterium]|jgi:hypothetical protein
MDRYDIARLIALIGALVLVAPALFYIVKDRKAAFRNAVIWFAIVGAVLLLWTAVFQG